MTVLSAEAPEDDPNRSPTGQVRQVGRYLIVSRLGRGGMASVFRAHDPSIGRDLAIKFLHASLSEDEDYRGRFLREARAAGGLSHPNITVVHDVGEIDGRPYMAMELVEGETLSDVLERTPTLPLRNVVLMGLQLARALAYAHERGVVHRDIKPGNIMVLSDGHTIKLTDFGIAYMDEGPGEQRTQIGAVIGTPQYMSPEQVLGNKVDGRSDLFSVGIVLYQMLSGARPFRGESLVAIATQIGHDEPKPLDHFRSDLPVSLVRIVARCLVKQPSQRFQSGQELAEALARVLAEVDAISSQGSRTTRNPLRRWWSRLWSARPGGFVAPERPDSSLPKPTSEPRPAQDPSEEQADANMQTVIRTAAVPAQGSPSAVLSGPATDGDRTLLLSAPPRGVPGPTGPMYLLVVRSEVASMVGRRYLLTAPAMRLGRTDGDVALLDPLLSRQHALVELGAASLTITDLGSANGTFVNGSRLAAHRPYPLLPGAHVLLGSTVLALALEQDDALPRLAGTELGGRFLLQECLHASPKGALYQAQKKYSRLPVALKLLAPAYASWAGYRESFATEAEIASTLQHPHICRLDDHGELDVSFNGSVVRTLFVAYEMMAGGNLLARMGSTATMPTATLLKWIRDLGSALEYVHRKGFVHGGLKPSAICFDADGNAYLTDFALGRPQGLRSALFGAPPFMAPEQLEGADASPASDQYALGVISYQLLTGVRPYDNQDDPRSRERNLQRAPPPAHLEALKNCRRSLPAALTPVINRALARKPENRHETVARFTARLTAALERGTDSGTGLPVFVSYERGPSSAWVNLIAYELQRRHGIGCFVDTVALDNAEQFPPRIRQAIRQCEVFVCVLGPTTLRSLWVRQEIAHAVRFRKTMVPVLLEGFVESAEDLKVKSIKQLLRYGGEPILDQQNIFVAEALQRIASRVQSGLGGNGHSAGPS